MPDIPLLTSHTWETSYRHEQGDLVALFYVLALSCAVQYDRMTGYFTSDALALAARGIEKLIANGGRMRLLVGCTLGPKEVEAIEQGYDLRQQVEDHLIKEPLSPPNPEAKNGLEALAWMIAHDQLDVKVAIPVSPAGQPIASIGIYHEKVGVIADQEGNRISFSGSINENRDEARIPLRDPATVEFLRTWIDGKPRDAMLFPGNWASNRYGGKLIQHDLKAAGIEYEVEGRKADFHALRYTFITNAIKSGELPATVQRLARHSDINLTFRVYADLGLEDLYHGASRGTAITPATAAKGGLRKRSKRVPTEAKNETADPAEQETGAKSVALNVALPVVPERPSVTPDVTTRVGGGEPARSPKPRMRSPKTQGATGDSSPCRPVSQNVETERVGFEPTRNLRPCRFSRPVQSATLPPLRGAM